MQGCHGKSQICTLYLVRVLGFGVYNRLEKGANLTPAAAMSLKATHTQTNHKKYLNKEVRNNAKQLGYFRAFCVSAPAFENFKTSIIHHIPVRLQYNVL